MQIPESRSFVIRSLEAGVGMSVDALIRRNWRYTALLDDRCRAVRRWLERGRPRDLERAYDLSDRILAEIFGDEQQPATVIRFPRERCRAPVDKEFPSVDREGKVIVTDDRAALPGITGPGRGRKRRR